MVDWVCVHQSPSRQCPTDVAQTSLFWEISQLELRWLETVLSWQWMLTLTSDFSAFIVANKMTCSNNVFLFRHLDSLSVETACAPVILYSLLTVSKIHSSKIWFALSSWFLFLLLPSLTYHILFSSWHSQYLKQKKCKTIVISAREMA